MDFVKQLVLALLLLFSWPAFSQVPDDYWTEFSDGGGRSSQDPIGLCRTMHPNVQIVGFDPTGGSTVAFHCIFQSGSNYYVIGNLYRMWCNPPNVFANGVCGPPIPTCTAGEELATLGDGKALSACIAGCQYDAVFYATKNADYKWRGTGKSCDGSEVEITDDPDGPPETEADKMCQVGTCRAKGTINGQTVDKCVPCNTVTTSNDKTSTKETTTTNPDGTTTTKTANTTSTSTTSCKDGTCTTTTQTTVLNEDGKEETTTETYEQDRGSFCEENPNHQLCKSSSWGGACGNYSCDGDAVQCAQARAAAELLCKLDVPANSEQAIAGQQAVNGTLSGSTPESITSSVGQFNTTNPYTSSCPGDVEVNVGGVASFSIPISRACPYIELIGWVLVAGATLAGARIAFT